MRVALFGAELARFINERSLQRFEETEAGVGLDEADPELLSELVATFDWSRDVPERLAEHTAIPGRRSKLYPHAVRVISPGGLTEPVTVENIRETQAARNYRVISRKLPLG